MIGAVGIYCNDGLPFRDMSKVSGQFVIKFLDKVFEPLGMKDTRWHR